MILALIPPMPCPAGSLPPSVYTRKAPFAEALCVEGSGLPLRGLCHPGKEAELRVLAGHVLVELPHGERHISDPTCSY